MTKKNQHIVPHGNGWAVKTEGSSQATKTFDNQKAAIAFGREQAIKYQSELFIHNREGQIRERNTYGNDPHPPKG